MMAVELCTVEHVKAALILLGDFPSMGSLPSLTMQASPVHSHNSWTAIYLSSFMHWHLSQTTGLQNSERNEIQQKWMNETVPVIVATISFGMGVDKANVR